MPSNWASATGWAGERLSDSTSAWRRAGRCRTQASPASGTYRDESGARVGHLSGRPRVSLERASGGIAVQQDLQGRAGAGGGCGAGASDYLRGTASGRWLARLGGTATPQPAIPGGGQQRPPAAPQLRDRRTGHAARRAVPSVRWRDTSALAHLEWRFEVPAPALRWAPLRPPAGSSPWRPSWRPATRPNPLQGCRGAGPDGIRPVAGLALEWFMRLLRLEAGVGLRDGGVGVTVDINRDWWGLL